MVSTVMEINLNVQRFFKRIRRTFTIYNISLFQFIFIEYRQGSGSGSGSGLDMSAPFLESGPRKAKMTPPPGPGLCQKVVFADPFLDPIGNGSGSEITDTHV